MNERNFRGSGNNYHGNRDTAAANAEIVVMPFKLTKGQISELRFDEYEEIE